MTLKEKFAEVELERGITSRLEQIAEEFAIEFKEWSGNKYKYLQGKGWFQTTYELEMGVFSSTKELLEIFKKEKGL